MANSGTFRAACVQMRAGINRHTNIRDSLALIDEAASAGANFIATPEMTNVVDANPKRLFAGLPDGSPLDEIEAFADAAKRHRVWLLAGSFAIKLGDRLAANRSHMFADDGRLVCVYDKLHMFDVDLPDGERWCESNVYKAGDRAIVAKTPFANVGMTICYDLRFPGLYRRLAQAGADLLCVPSAFTRQTGRAHWQPLLTARAIETGSFVIAPGQGGDHEDGRTTWGHSMIIDPWGKILAASDNDEPGVIVADIDIKDAAMARTRIPNLGLEQSYEIAILPE